MKRLQTPGHGSTGYGLGFMIENGGGLELAGHSGSVSGYTAYLVFEPRSRLGVILLRNYASGATNLGQAGEPYCGS